MAIVVHFFSTGKVKNQFLKLMDVTVFGYLIVISIDFLRFYFSISWLFLVSIEMIYQTLKTMFDHIFKHLEARQKYSATRRILSSPLGVR